MINTHGHDKQNSDRRTGVYHKADALNVKWQHPGNLLECDYCDRHEICCCKCNNKDKCLGAILRVGDTHRC